MYSELWTRPVPLGDGKQVRGCFGMRLTGSGHKGTLWSDENGLPLHAFCSSGFPVPRLPVFYFGSCLSLSQSLQAQRLSTPKELVTIPPSPRSPLCSTPTYYPRPFPFSLELNLDFIPYLFFVPKYSVFLLAAGSIPARL